MVFLSSNETLLENERNHSSGSMIIAAIVLVFVFLGTAIAQEIPEPTTIIDTNFREHNGGSAHGKALVINGKIVDAKGNPASEALVYIKQTDANGRYVSQARRANALDSNFKYEGWIRTDENGRFVLRTIVPAAYVNSQTQIPHIHMEARHGGKKSLYRTLAFPQFPPRNGSRDYLKRTDKWILIVDLKRNGDNVLEGKMELVVK